MILKLNISTSSAGLGFLLGKLCYSRPSSRSAELQGPAEAESKDAAVAHSHWLKVSLVTPVSHWRHLL